MLLFISYSNEDKKLAEKIKEEFQNKIKMSEEFDIFLGSDSIPISDRFHENIVKAICEADIFLAILTKNYSESQWCTEEWQIAHNQYLKSKDISNTPPSPLLVHLELDKEALSPWQQIYQNIVATSLSHDKIIEKLLNEIQAVIKQHRKYKNVLVQQEKLDFLIPKETAYFFPTDLNSTISFADVQIQINPKYDIDPNIPELYEAWTSFINKPQNRFRYNGLLYRLIAPPNYLNGKLILKVSRIRYAAIIALRSSNSIFDKSKAKIKELLYRLTDTNRLEENVFKTFNPSNENIIPIGVEVLFITSDKKLLLRHRGSLHDTGVGRWGISFAGYMLSDRDEINGKINPLYTIYREASYELRLAIEVRMVKCVGFHYNKEGRTMDILSVYPSIREDSYEVFSNLSEGARPRDGIPFKTTKHLEEIQLEHGLNVFLPFDKKEFNKYFVDKCTNPEKCGILTPEAYNNICHSQSLSLSRASY